MMLRRAFKWIGWFSFALVLLIALGIAFFDWNWLRASIERMTMEKTGRELAIKGNLAVRLGWPLPRIRAERVTFANPPWAKDKQMVAADAVEISLDLLELLDKKLVLPEVRLENPLVVLEMGANGRKNWLLDHNQQDEDARVQIGRVMLDHGRIAYADPQQKTSIQAEISTPEAQQDGIPAGSVVFSAQGTYIGLPLSAHGRGGPVLALRDESTPYVLKIDAAIGRTSLQADGSITSLSKFSAIDMRLALRGDSLAQLFPLLGIAFPETHPYRATGHLAHNARMWRYEKFSGRIGKSEVTGTLQVDTGATRPFLHGDMVFQQLDLDDLGPVIGVKEAGNTATGQLSTRQSAELKDQKAPPSASTRSTGDASRVLPEIPFRTDRWDSVDAAVSLRAKSILREKQLPLENLVTVVKMRDSVLTLEPLNFGLAGGELLATISLDGRQDPIRAHAKVRARKILLGKLFPTVDLTKTSVGQINGDFDLAGSGNSVGRMLATSDGKVGLVIADGEISKMMMETVGLHLWEMLKLKIGGDKNVKIRCAVGNFSVKSGVMHADALVLDTESTTISGRGSIDLGRERLDLTLGQKTKDTSIVALRGPIYVRGSLAHPDFKLDAGRVAARGAGAIILGIVNPLLVLLPLVETGPGMDSDCGRLIREAQEPLSNSVQPHARASTPESAMR
jgi:uncharacterized protein involved in outer membrane biogenesis